jgi:hypothetical protein
MSGDSVVERELLLLQSELFAADLGFLDLAMDL